MFDKEKFTPEFYDKLSDSEKKELVQVMLEDQLTDALHIKGLPKPVQNCIKSAVKSSAKDMKEKTICGYPAEWVEGIKSKDEIIVTGATKNFKPNQKFDRLQKIVDECISDRQYTRDSIINAIGRNVMDKPFPVMTEADKLFIHEEVIKPVRQVMIDQAFNKMKRLSPFERFNKIYLDSLPKAYMTKPRGIGYKSWLWVNMLIEAMSSDNPLFQFDHNGIPKPPPTTAQFRDVIHWNHEHINYLEDIKIRDCRARHALEELVGYNDLSPISQMIVDSLKVAGPKMLEEGKLVGPNFNEDKKRLERTIKKGRKRK